MFSGIIEGIGTLASVSKQSGNLLLEIQADFSKELKIDQSVAHNGVCLTVIRKTDHSYFVEAIAETIKKSNIGDLQPGDKVNLERCLKVDARIDGHFVQGHVDTKGSVLSISKLEGSHVVEVAYHSDEFSTVPQGSICLNGISLTVMDSKPQSFSVAIIPYTWQNTNLCALKEGMYVNLEFDILGKYIQSFMQKRQTS